MKVSAKLVLAFCASTYVFAGYAEGRKVLFIGDSITDGAWGRSGGAAMSSDQRNHWDLNHIYGHSFVFLCASYYQAEYPEANWEFYNRGISGNQLTDLELRWDKDVLELKPDVVSILVGTNDVDAYLNSNSSADFNLIDWEKRYRSLLDQARKDNSQVKFVLCAPFVENVGRMKESKNFIRRNELIRDCAAVVEKIAVDYDATFLPYNQMFDDLYEDHTTLRDTYWIWDGIHPTAAGHKKMADAWIEAMGDLNKNH